MKLILIAFQDPTCFSQWATADEVDQSEPKVVVGAGLLVEENKDVVKVALLTSLDGQNFSNWIVVPLNCILYSEEAKEVDLKEIWERLKIKSTPPTA